jgi:hypothetical protein
MLCWRVFTQSRQVLHDLIGATMESNWIENMEMSPSFKPVSTCYGREGRLFGACIYVLRPHICRHILGFCSTTLLALEPLPHESNLCYAHKARELSLRDMGQL